MTDLKQTQKKRTDFLLKVFESTDGNETAAISMWEIGNSIGLDRSETQKIYNYLSGEGVINARGMGGAIGITHAGIVAIEDMTVHKQIATLPSIKSIDFFICHSTLDYNIARAVEQILENAGYSAFLAHKDLPHGKDWHLGIKSSIKDTNKMIVIGSKNLQSSTYCHYEIGYADCLDIPVHVLALENEKDFDAYIQQRQLTIVTQEDRFSRLKTFFSKVADAPIIPSDQDLAILEKSILDYQSNKRTPQVNLSELIGESVKTKEWIAARMNNPDVDIDYEFFVKSAEENEKVLRELGFWETYKDIKRTLRFANKPYHDMSVLRTLHERLEGFSKALRIKIEQD